jgi:C_GCAxxG_C_C family probable redox protein
MTKGEIAKQNFLNGYNCTQAVIKAFSDELGFDCDTLMMLAQPFGGGMGRMREVCGTLSAMYMILGLKKGSSNPSDKNAKTSIYKDVQALAEQFKADNGSIICRELLDLRIKGRDSPMPSERTEQYYQSRPCSELCRYAADLIDSFLMAKNM